MDDSGILEMCVTASIVIAIASILTYHSLESECQTAYNVADCTWIMVPQHNWEQHVPPIPESLNETSK